MAQAATTLGQRIGSYRRRNSITAADLASRSGAGLTRSIIANIENGRRIDVTVTQLLAISRTLGVPPIALIFDIERPASTFEVERDGGPMTLGLTRAIEWFTGDPIEGPGERTPAGDHAVRVLTALRAWERARGRLGMAESRRNTATTRDDALEAEIDELTQEVRELEGYLGSLNVDLTAG